MTTIAELIESGSLAVGDGYRAKNSEMTRRDGLPFARAGNVKGRLDLTGADILDAASVLKAGTKVSTPGDVVFTSKGTVGRVVLIRASDPTCVYSPQLCCWRVINTDRIDPLYLYYWFQSAESRTQLNARKGLTDMADYVSLRDQRSIVISLPPIGVQRLTSSVLGALDEKREHNRRYAESLSGVSSALFRRRYLDFEGESNLVTSPLGDIPRRWRIRSLSQCARFINGGALTRRATGNGSPILRIADLTGALGPATKYGAFNAPADQQVHPGDILFAWSGSLGLHRWFGDHAYVNQHIFKVVPYHGVPAWFVWFSTRHHLSRFRDIARDKATTMGHIRRKDLDEAMVVVPVDWNAAEAPILAAWWERSLLLARESSMLLSLRDTLIPPLLSGRMTVTEIDTLIGR